MKLLTTLKLLVFVGVIAFTITETSATFAQCVAAPVPNDACYNFVITTDTYCCNTLWDGICQTEYDDCVGSATGPCASITPIIGCGTSTGVTLSGTGAGWSDVGNCGFATPGTESIFSFTATASGIHQLEITSISGGYLDFAWIDATSGCSSGAFWNCIATPFTTGLYGSMNWIAGQTYYILIDPESTGTSSVTFNIDCPNPGTPVTASDCGVAVPVCTNLAFQVDPSGYGLVDELCTYCVANPSTNPSGSNSGCLLSGELNSTWFTVNVAVGGTLEFSFGTPNSGNCFDWIMWDYTPATCAAILGNTQAPVTCNWNFPCEGFTGMATTAPPGGTQTNFQPTMNVNAGDQFVICFSNYSSALTSVPLDFFGSADISCTLLPVEMTELKVTASEDYNTLSWGTLTEFHNSHFEIEHSSNGIEFNTVGEVQGAGTSNSAHDYSFEHPGFGDQVNYYRVKQVDIDGGFRYSNIVSIENKSTKTFKIVKAYPNPTSDQFTLQVYTNRSGSYTLKVTDQIGAISHDFGSQKLDKGFSTITIPVSMLSSGLYTVQLSELQSGEIETKKLIVQ